MNPPINIKLSNVNGPKSAEGKWCLQKPDYFLSQQPNERVWDDALVSNKSSKNCLKKSAALHSFL
jgi:hypothetical protein